MTLNQGEQDCDCRKTRPPLLVRHIRLADQRLRWGLVRGADVAVRNRNGKTPLMLAEEAAGKSIFSPTGEECKAVADLLRKHGAEE